MFLKRALLLVVGLCCLGHVAESLAAEGHIVSVLLDDSGSMSGLDLAFDGNDPNGSAAFAVMQLIRFVPANTRVIVYTYASLKPEAGSPQPFFDSGTLTTSNRDSVVRQFRKEIDGVDRHLYKFGSTPCRFALEKASEDLNGRIKDPLSVAFIYLTDGVCSPGEEPKAAEAQNGLPRDRGGNIARFYFIQYRTTEGSRSLGVCPPGVDTKSLAGLTHGTTTCTGAKGTTAEENVLAAMEVFGEILDRIDNNRSTKTIPPDNGLNLNQAIGVRLLFAGKCSSDSECRVCGELAGKLKDSDSQVWKWWQMTRGGNGVSRVAGGPISQRFCYVYSNIRDASVVRAAQTFITEHTSADSTRTKAVLRPEYRLEPEIKVFEGKCSDLGSGTREVKGKAAPSVKDVCIQGRIVAKKDTPEPARWDTLNIAYSPSKEVRGINDRGHLPKGLVGTIAIPGLASTKVDGNLADAPVWLLDATLPECDTLDGSGCSIDASFSVEFDKQIVSKTPSIRLYRTCRNVDEDEVCDAFDCNTVEKNTANQVLRKTLGHRSYQGSPCTVKDLPPENTCPEGKWQCVNPGPKGRWECNFPAGLSDLDRDNEYDCYDKDIDGDDCPNTMDPTPRDTAIPTAKDDCKAKLPFWALDFAKSQCGEDSTDEVCVIDLGTISPSGRLFSLYLDEKKTALRGKSSSGEDVVVSFPVKLVWEDATEEERNHFSFPDALESSLPVRETTSDKPNRLDVRIAPKVHTQDLASKKETFGFDVTGKLNPGELSPSVQEHKLETLTFRVRGKYARELELNGGEKVIRVPPDEENSTQNASFTITNGLGENVSLVISEHLEILQLVDKGEGRALSDRIRDFSYWEPEDESSKRPQVRWTDCEGTLYSIDAEIPLPYEEPVKFCVDVENLELCKGRFYSVLGGQFCASTAEQFTVRLLDVYVDHEPAEINSGSVSSERSSVVNLMVERTFLAWLFNGLWGGWFWIVILALIWFITCAVIRKVSCFSERQDITFTTVGCAFIDANGTPQLGHKWNAPAEIPLHRERHGENRAPAANHKPSGCMRRDAWWISANIHTHLNFFMGVRPKGGKVGISMTHVRYGSQAIAEAALFGLVFGAVPPAELNPRTVSVPECRIGPNEFYVWLPEDRGVQQIDQYILYIVTIRHN